MYIDITILCKVEKQPLTILPIHNSALDAGCGPGRTALELCSVFTQVEAYDYSQGFVDMMIKEKLKRGIQHLEAYQGDSHCQEEMARIKKFDLIHGCNLIDRLHSPEKWVAQSKVFIPQSITILDYIRY